MPFEEQIAQLDQIAKHLQQAGAVSSWLSSQYGKSGQTLKKADVDEINRLIADACQIALELRETICLEHTEA